jgi:homoserine kinase type II
LISEELIYLQDLPSDLPKGIIHADLFRDNVLFEDDTIGGIIDFYYACTDYFIYDIAIVINDWCTNNDGSINRTRQEIFLEAYDKNRVLKQKEYDALGGYLRLAAMRFLLSRYQDQLSKKEAELNQPKDPLFFQEILSLRRLGK